jgi:hypothetical protein
LICDTFLLWCLLVVADNGECGEMGLGCLTKHSGTGADCVRFGRSR